MLNWFDEPLLGYRRFAPMRSGIFDYMGRWMDAVDREMTREFGKLYDTFIPIEDQNEKKEDGKEEAKEEITPDSDDESQYYSINTSMYSGAGGVQHIRREEVDSRSGKKKVTETRRIGNQSMTLHLVTDKDGKTEKHETLKNIKEDEVEAFMDKWKELNNKRQDAIEGPKEEKKD